MWKVYKCTRNYEDYTNYKEAVNAATTEIKNLKEAIKKLPCNIKERILVYYQFQMLNSRMLNQTIKGS